MLYLSFFLNLLVLIGASIYVAYLMETIANSRRNRILYHSSNVREQGAILAETIKRYVPDTEKYVLVEIGAGLARVAQHLKANLGWKDVEAVEIGPVIAFIGKLRFLFIKPAVRYVRRDVFSYDLPTPAVVYAYVSEEILTNLHKEGRLDGRLVIALTFRIRDLVPTEEIPLKSWQNRILVYDLRSAKGVPASEKKANAGNGEN